jgi:rRNA maturation protein Nop10
MRHGNKKCGVATWHENTCDICGATAAVAEPRDFGHLKDTWIKAVESRSDEQQNCYPYVEIQGNTIAEISSRNDQLNKELAAVTEQRDRLEEAMRQMTPSGDIVICSQSATNLTTNEL